MATLTSTFDRLRRANHTLDMCDRMFIRLAKVMRDADHKLNKTSTEQRRRNSAAAGEPRPTRGRGRRPSDRAFGTANFSKGRARKDSHVAALSQTAEPEMRLSNDAAANSDAFVSSSDDRKESSEGTARPSLLLPPPPSPPPPAQPKYFSDIIEAGFVKFLPSHESCFTDDEDMDAELSDEYLTDAERERDSPVVRGSPSTSPSTNFDGTLAKEPGSKEENGFRLVVTNVEPSFSDDEAPPHYRRYFRLEATTNTCDKQEVDEFVKQMEESAIKLKAAGFRQTEEIKDEGVLGLMRFCAMKALLPAETVKPVQVVNCLASVGRPATPPPAVVPNAYETGPHASGPHLKPEPTSMPNTHVFEREDEEAQFMNGSALGEMFRGTPPEYQVPQRSFFQPQHLSQEQPALSGVRLDGHDWSREHRPSSAGLRQGDLPFSRPHQGPSPAAAPRALPTGQHQLQQQQQHQGLLHSRPGSVGVSSSGGSGRSGYIPYTQLPRITAGNKPGRPRGSTKAKSLAKHQQRLKGSAAKDPPPNPLNDQRLPSVLGPRPQQQTRPPRGGANRVAPIRPLLQNASGMANTVRPLILPTNMPGFVSSVPIGTRVIDGPVTPRPRRSLVAEWYKTGFMNVVSRIKVLEFPEGHVHPEDPVFNILISHHNASMACWVLSNPRELTCQLAATKKPAVTSGRGGKDKDKEKDKDKLPREDRKLPEKERWKLWKEADSDSSDDEFEKYYVGHTDDEAGGLLDADRNFWLDSVTGEIKPHP